MRAVAMFSDYLKALTFQKLPEKCTMQSFFCTVQLQGGLKQISMRFEADKHTDYQTFSAVELRVQACSVSEV